MSCRDIGHIIQLTSAGATLSTDPYAGVFFSKDRVEEIVEPIEQLQRCTIDASFGRKLTVEILGPGRWMSGCPEAGEQSHLFQLYSLLESESFHCPYGCGTTMSRKEGDFFALFVRPHSSYLTCILTGQKDFDTYTAHLMSIIRPTCPGCGNVVCLACGERAETAKSASKTSGCQDGSSAGNDGVVELDELLHCVQIQVSRSGAAVLMTRVS